MGKTEISPSAAMLSRFHSSLNLVTNLEKIDKLLFDALFKYNLVQIFHCFFKVVFSANNFLPSKEDKKGKKKFKMKFLKTRFYLRARQSLFANFLAILRCILEDAACLQTCIPYL